MSDKRRKTPGTYNLKRVKYVNKKGEVKYYYYGTKEKGYIPGVARAAQAAKKQAALQSKLQKKISEKAKRNIKKKQWQALKEAQKIRRHKLIDAKGRVRKKVKEELMKAIDNESTMGIAQKMDFKEWLDDNLSGDFPESEIIKHPGISINSVIGLYSEGGRTIKMLYNTGFGIDEMASYFNVEFNDPITANDLLDMSNWNGTYFTSPKTGYVYKFEFKYNEYPFTRVS